MQHFIWFKQWRNMLTLVRKPLSLQFCHCCQGYRLIHTCLRQPCWWSVGVHEVYLIYSTLYSLICCPKFPVKVLNSVPVTNLYRNVQPRPQGAFPWLWGRGPAPKAREKCPGDEVEKCELYHRCIWVVTLSWDFVYRVKSQNHLVNHKQYQCPAQ